MDIALAATAAVTKVVLVACIGTIATRLLGNPNSPGSISFITTKFFLPCLLTARLAKELPTAPTEYYWAIPLSIVAMLAGFLPSRYLFGPLLLSGIDGSRDNSDNPHYSGDAAEGAGGAAPDPATQDITTTTTKDDLIPLLVLGCTFQNTIAYGLGIMLNITSVSWLTQAARREIEMVVFLYNICFSPMLWGVGEYLVKCAKAAAIAREYAQRRALKEAQIAGEMSIIKARRDRVFQVDRAFSEPSPNAVETLSAAGTTNIVYNETKAQRMMDRLYQEQQNSGTGNAGLPGVAEADVSRKEGGAREGSGRNPLALDDPNTHAIAVRMADSLNPSMSENSEDDAGGPGASMNKGVVNFLIQFFGNITVIASIMGIVLALAPGFSFLAQKTTLGTVLLGAMETVGVATVPATLLLLGMNLAKEGSKSLEPKKKTDGKTRVAKEKADDASASPGQSPTSPLPASPASPPNAEAINSGSSPATSPAGPGHDDKVDTNINSNDDKQATGVSPFVRRVRDGIYQFFGSLEFPKRFLFIIIFVRLFFIPFIFLLTLFMLDAVLPPSLAIPKTKPFRLAVLVLSCAPTAINTTMQCQMHHFKARPFAQVIMLVYFACIPTSCLWVSIYLWIIGS